MAPHRPRMVIPLGQLMPHDLCEEIRHWAEAQGYLYHLRSHGTEYGVIVLEDLTGWHTYTTIPNAHKGRRLRKDQVRYCVQNLNNRWRN